MQFAAIMPVKAFERFGTRSKTHMALVQYLDIPEYFRFFQQRREAGDTVILDNGAYEGVRAQMGNLDYWVRRLRPSVVVLPDAPGDLARTIQHSYNYLDQYGLPYDVEGMTVLHAADGDMHAFLAAYRTCPTKWVGLSRLTRRYSIDDTWRRRWKFLRFLHDEVYWRKDLTHHCLGMLNANLDELPLINEEGANSIDSSCAIWRGLHGYSLNDPTWPNYEFHPLITEEATNWHQAELNLQEVHKACGQS